LQHVCVFLVAWEKTSFLKYGHCLHCLAKTSKKEKNKNHFWSPETLSQRKAKGRLSHCRETQKIKQKQMHVFFFMCVYFSLFVHCVFNYVQFCSFLFTCCSVFSFIFMLFISFHFLHFSSLEKQLPIQTTCMSTHYLLLLKYSFRKMHIYIYIFIHIFIDGFRVFQPPQKHRFA
jgi:hypothetical protein